MTTDRLAELKRLPQWVVSKLVPTDKPGQFTKPPFQLNGKRASVNDPTTWTTYEKAVAAGWPMIGFVLTAHDPFAVIDLDNPANATQRQRHAALLQSAQTYAEISHSGKGVHIILKGGVPKGLHRENVEIYSDKRFIVMTEKPINDFAIEERQSWLTSVYDSLCPQVSLPNAGADPQADTETLSDASLIETAVGASNAAKFNRLCHGEWRGEYPSQSEADYALLAMLCFYTRSNTQVKRLFRMSALGKRDKAQRDNYLDNAIAKIRANEPPPIDISALEALETFETQGPAPVSELLKDDIEFPPGVLGQLAQHMFDNAIRPVREISLVAALGLAAGLAGRGFNISQTGLNLYLILLAGTGTGKDGLGAGMEHVLSQLAPTIPAIVDTIGPAGFASGQALVRTLDNRPCFVSVLGEFGLTLAQLCSPRANAAQVMLRRVMLDVFSKSGAGKVLRSSVYADSDKNTKIIEGPCVSLVGESTPETFFENITADHIAEGLIPRFSIVEYRGPRPPRNTTQTALRPDVLQAIENATVQALKNEQLNAPQEVQIDVEASKTLDAFDREADAEINSASHDVTAQLWNRAHLKVLKLAALVAVFNNPEQPIISTLEAEWAIRFVRRELAGIMERFDSGLFAGGDARQEADLMGIIHTYLGLSLKKRLAARVPKDLAKIKNLVPYSFLRIRALRLKSFREDRAGATNALQKVLRELVATDILQDAVPPVTGITQRVFLLTDEGRRKYAF